MTRPPKKEYTEEEVQQRAHGALKRLLNTPPKPLTKPKPDGDRKKRGRPPKKLANP